MRHKVDCTNVGSSASNVAMADSTDNSINEADDISSLSALQSKKTEIAAAVLDLMRMSGQSVSSFSDITESVREQSSSILAEVIEMLLKSEMTAHIGAEPYERLDPQLMTDEDDSAADKPTSRNYRNGSYKRHLRTKMGDIDIKNPRDRNGTFNPVTLRKGMLEDKEAISEEILKLVAMGNSTRDVADILQSMMGVGISHEYVQSVIEAFTKDYAEWLARPVDQFYPFIYVDCMYVDVRNTDGKVVNKPVYVILGVDVSGHKSIIDIAMSEQSEAESKSYWLNRFDSLKQRGLKDVLFVCMDGVSGLEDGVKTMFPDAIVQRCIVHLVRNTIKLVGKRSRDKWCKDLRAIYAAPDFESSLMALETLSKNWSETRPAAVRYINERYHVYIQPLFELPPNIRRIVYTNNWIESVNSSLRHVVKKGVFGNDRSVVTLMLLRISKHLQPSWENYAISGWSGVLDSLLDCDLTREKVQRNMKEMHEM